MILKILQTIRRFFLGMQALRIYRQKRAKIKILTQDTFL